MIISASINADVPARHGEWFMRRLDAGFCRIAGADPFQARRVVLTRDAVDAFVFWTRNVAPFLAALQEIHRRGFPFIVQYAVTQPAVAPARFRRIADMFGPRTAVWRFDPVTAAEPAQPDQLAERFARIAGALRGATDEVVLAFARAKSKPRLDATGTWAAATPESIANRSLVKRLAVIAGDHDMRLTLCAQPEFLTAGTAPARCIDLRRLRSVCGRSLDVDTAGFFPDCLCARAIDIGDWPGVGARRFCGEPPRPARGSMHDPSSEFLLQPLSRFSAAIADDIPF